MVLKYRIHMAKRTEPLVSCEDISTLEQCQLNSSLRPLVEYASTVWGPYTQANIQKLEMVQRRAARYVMNRQRNTSSVSDMLQRLNWRSHERRRKDARLCMMFKIDRRLVAISKESRLQPALKEKNNKATASQSFPYNPLQNRQEEMSFFPRTVRDWNSRAPDIIDSETLEAFKASVSSMEYLTSSHSCRF